MCKNMHDEDINGNGWCHIGAKPKVNCDDDCKFHLHECLPYFMKKN